MPARRVRVGGFWRQRQKITVERRIDSAGGFHRDVEPGRRETSGQEANLPLQERLTPGHHHVPEARGHRPVNQLPHRPALPFRLP
jgi:hypothetical protein